MSPAMNWKTLYTLGVLGCLGCGFATTASGQAPARTRAQEFDIELRYVELLQAELLPDLAEIVLRQIKAKFTEPEFTAQLLVKEISGLVMLARYDEAQKILDAQPDKGAFTTWQMRLLIANGYLQSNKHDDFVDMYKRFFAAFPAAPAGKERDYLNICYTYVQLLARQKRFAKESIEAYKMLLAQPMPESERRFFRSDMIAQMLVVAEGMASDPSARAALLKEADTENDKQFWVQDALFGQAIVAKAHILKLQGKTEEAQKMLDFYMPQLNEIHRRLKEAAEREKDPAILRDSPMPQCRFLLASILWKEVLKLAEEPNNKANDEKIRSLLLGEKDNRGQRRGNGAYNHFVNVFANYPESRWAMDAGEMSETVAAFMNERFKAELRAPIVPPFNEAVMERMMQEQYTAAKAVLDDEDFLNAIEQLEAFLGRFPDRRFSFLAHGLLARAYAGQYANENDPNEKELLEIYLDTVVANLAERSAGLRDAGTRTAAVTELRNIADAMPGFNLANKREAYYVLFFRNHPADAAAPAALHRFAEDSFKADDTEKALKYFTLLEEYPGYTHYYQVLTRLATLCKKQGNLEGQIEYLNKAVALMQDPKNAATRNAVDYIRLLIMRANETRAPVLARLRDPAADRAAINKDLNTVSKLYEEAKKEVADALKGLPNDKDLKELQEAATFLFISTYEFIQQPPEKLEETRKTVVNHYEKFVRDFPKSEWAPRALVQIGTIHILMKDSAKTEGAFKRLQDNYPESDEAKNSIPRLAKALMDQGYSEEGRDQYRKMFGADKGNYTPLQYYEAGLALLEARDFELALEAFGNATRDENTALQMEVLYGRAQALFGQQKYEDARAVLLEFEKRYGNTERILDAWFLLVEVHSLIGEQEKDSKKRTESFNAGVNILRKIAVYLKTPVGRAQTDLAAARLLVRRMKAEETAGLEADARKTAGLAAQGYIALIALPPNDEKFASFLHDSYREGIDILLNKTKTPDFALEYADQYLKTFPEGRHAATIRNLRNQALAQISSQN